MFREERVRIVALALIVWFMPLVAFADGAVKVSWNANTENDLAGYRIYYGTAAGTYPLVLDAGKVVTYTVGSLKDGSTYFFVLTAYDNSGNESGYSPEAAATIPGGGPLPTADTTAPRIVSVSINSPTQVVLVFSESVAMAGAQETGNYRISDGVLVMNAALANSGIEVTLTTNAHQEDHDYVLTSSNIRDLSPAGNMIAANSRMSYRLAGNGNPPPNDGGLLINSLSIANYQIDSLHVGGLYYIDRAYRLNRVPTILRGALLIKTGNADKTNDSEEFLVFNLNREADIYIAYDNRASSVPSWLSRDFDKTDEYLGVTESGGRLNLWRGHFLPGQVKLGGNLANNAANADAMYIVVIDDLQNDVAQAIEPRTFELQQNYPNPFNPSTEIVYYVKRDARLTINIYNALGQLVRTLYDGQQNAGHHRVTWDARNNDGQSVPSGMYLYTLEAKEEIGSGAVTMNSTILRLSRTMTLLK